MKKTDKKILLVEDDKDYLWLLRQNFDAEGIPVIYALDGEEGLEMAQKEKPDLIIADILMPKMNGMEMAKKLRKINEETPIIFLTNVEDMASISEAFKMTKSDYFVKTTVHIDNIVTAVKEKLNIK